MTWLCSRKSALLAVAVLDDFGLFCCTKAVVSFSEPTACGRIKMPLNFVLAIIIITLQYKWKCQ